MRIMNKFFSEPYFEIWLKEAHPKIKEWFKKEVEYLKKYIKPKSKVLDVGCGFGRHIKVLAPFSEEVVGIDNNEDMIKKAKNNLSNLSNAKILLQDAKKLEFESDYFDYVICMTNTFGDFPNIELDALKEMKRVCKKDGKIIISVYNDKAFKIRKKGYEKVGLHITKIKNGIVCTQEGLISKQFTKKELKELFDKVKLKSKILELSPISFLCELNY